ncbi:MAG: NAD+ synthase [Alphaproteobacteria bacterium]|nr:NAD+ synthase [Alphaproteobacteria bacterium]
MTDTLIIALAQLNLTMGSIDDNVEKIKAAHQNAAKQGAELVVTSELSISAYPPEDLTLRPAYVQACMKAVEQLAVITKDSAALIIGLPWQHETSAKPYNAAALLRNGAIEQVWYKYDLPNYGVFDDKRVFTAGGKDEGEPFLMGGARIGVVICEDMWSKDKANSLKRRGAQILISINASPFETDKSSMRRAIMTARIKETGVPVIYLNQLGGQDEMVFDGGSFVLDAQATERVNLGEYQEKLQLTYWYKQGEQWVPQQEELPKPLSEEERIYSALVLALRDYVTKNGFPGVLIGMSGGIDSAFVAALAVDALGKDKVINVMMPSPYTSKDSLEDAQKASTMLGCAHKTISIEDGMKALGAAVKPHSKGFNTDIADQNIQSRLRGLILMTLSNTYGHMVLATGNKSEMATGYATLYGDMCGGFALIKDIYKTLVFRLCKWRNVNKPAIGLGPLGFVMPDRIITRPPSAELKPGQVDQDTLPPYAQLDDILQCLIEREMSVPDIVGRGHDEATVTKVLRMLKFSEYKRRQAPPGVKITAHSFGRERRYPITNKFVG